MYKSLAVTEVTSLTLFITDEYMGSGDWDFTLGDFKLIVKNVVDL